MTNQEVIYELMKRASKISTMIGKMQKKTDELNEVLYNALEEVFKIIEEDEKQLPKNNNNKAKSYRV